VQDSVLNSGWQSVLVAIPFIFMMMVGVFRLDELIAAQKKSVKRQRPASGVDQDGRPLLCDPDGRPVRSLRNRK